MTRALKLIPAAITMSLLCVSLPTAGETCSHTPQGLPLCPFVFDPAITSREPFQTASVAFCDGEFDNACGTGNQEQMAFDLVVDNPLDLNLTCEVDNPNSTGPDDPTPICFMTNDCSELLSCGLDSATLVGPVPTADLKIVLENTGNAVTCFNGPSVSCTFRCSTPGGVAGLALRRVNGGTSLELTWVDVPGAEFYLVYEDPAPQGGFSRVADGTSSGTDGAVIPLPVDTRYYLVAASNECGEGPKR